MKVTLVVLTAILAATCALWLKEMEDEKLVEDDIDIVTEDILCQNQLTNTGGGKWPGAKIPFVIDSSIGQGSPVIYAAITDYHRYTCLRFSRRTNEKSYIKFYRGSGCSSPVGYKSERVNNVSLAPGCLWKRIVMHEIGHSIGLYHEQSRPDRNKYVEILWNNIQMGMRYNFATQQQSEINSIGTEYDYRSMMHSGQNAFGGGLMTIRTKDPSMQNVIGGGSGFSEIDKKQINLMYCSGNDGGV